MINWPDTVEMKKNKEKSVSEMEYESPLAWRYMKRLRSETKVRHWHIKVDSGQVNAKGMPIYDDYNVAQMWVHMLGEKLYAYKASRSGRPINIMEVLINKRGKNHLHGIEYLLRHLNGEDITDLDLGVE